MTATNYLLSHLTIVSLLVASTMAIFPGQINANNNFLLTATKKHVSIQADNASLAEILREIENQTGIVMTFDSSLNVVVSTEMVEQPLQVAIDKLAPNNLVVNGFLDGTISIKEVIIISDVESSSGNVGFEYYPVVILHRKTALTSYNRIRVRRSNRCWSSLNTIPMETRYWSIEYLAPLSTP